MYLSWAHDKRYALQFQSKNRKGVAVDIVDIDIADIFIKAEKAK